MFNKFHPTLSAHTLRAQTLRALTLRALKGAPLTCLFFLGNQPQPHTATQGLTVTQLSHLTGYSRRTVREALALLVELRLAARCRVQGRARAYRLFPSDRASPIIPEPQDCDRLFHPGETDHARSEIQNR